MKLSLFRSVLFPLFVFVLLSGGCVSTSRMKGRVVKVQDGDTFTMLTNANEQVKVRLYGIDAPEKGQDFSQKSKDYLSNLVAGKMIAVDNKGTDQYKRMLGVVYVNKLNVNEEMLRKGFAWQYKYNDDPRYLELQEKARKKKLNIWSMKNPVDPWQWRKEHSRKNKK